METCINLNASKSQEIIQAYINLTPNSVVPYNQLYKAVDLFEKWNENDRIEFLTQFFNLNHLLDVNCNEIVAQFCKIKWHSVPQSIRKDFVQFLASLAINHVFHVEMVFKTIIEHFMPEIRKDENSVHGVLTFDYDIQEELYELAHSCLKTILACIPLSSSLLIQCCKANFPHYRHSILKTLGYLRNLIVLAETYEIISADLWSIIIDQLIYLDTLNCSRRQFFTDFFDSNENVFSQDEKFMEEKIKNDDSSSLNNDLTDDKLDLCVSMILAYISVNYSKNDDFEELQKDSNFYWIFSRNRTPKITNLLSTLMTGFEEHVLYSLNIHSVPYIWFYLCSLSTINIEKMLFFLFNKIKQIVRSPNEWKKAQNSAAFLCGFLARANFINFSSACIWLKRMATWCCDYVEQENLINTQSIGGIQHGTFYATVQALLFVICYRYNEFKNNNAIKNVLVMGLGRIIHSKLQPLRFISPSVALCFANISRYLQIVYCSHILSFNDSMRHRTVELFFPFSFCSLNRCSTKILLLMRKFEVLNAQHEIFSGIKPRKNGDFVETSSSMNNMEKDDYDFMQMES